MHSSFCALLFTAVLLLPHGALGFHVRPLGGHKMPMTKVSGSSFVILRSSPDVDADDPKRPTSLEMTVSEQQPKSQEMVVLEQQTTTSQEMIVPVLEQEQPTNGDLFERTSRKWTMRLNTKEDPLWVHKVGSIGSVVSTLAIFGVAGYTHLEYLPTWLGPINWIFVFSYLSLSLGAIDMTWKYRRNGMAGLTGFLGGAFATMLVVVATEWLSPFWPDGLLSDEAVLLFCWLTGLASSAFFAYSLLEPGESIADRNQRDHRLDHRPTNNYIVDYLVYVFPSLSAVVMTLCFCWVLSFGRQQLEATFPVLNSCSVEESMAWTYFRGVMVTFCITNTAFTITLRDKHLISKQLESVLITALNVAIIAVVAQGISVAYPNLDF